jgi:pyruvate-formate lyase-activating enzyme
MRIMLVQASDKLSFHWERVASLLDGKLDSYPITVHVGPMAGCNQDCVWCSDLDYRRKYAGYLDVDRFIPILGEWAAGARE